MRLSAFDCVVLDLDDTLFLERDYVKSGFRAVNLYLEVELGIAGFFDISWRLFENGARGDIFDQTLAALGETEDPNLVSNLLGVYRNHSPELSMFPDAVAALQELAHRFIAVVTDGPVESQRAKAEAIGANDWSSLTIFTSELGPGHEKPDQEPFRLAQEASGVPSSRIAYVADNPKKDFIAPNRLGWTTVRVRRPGSLHEATVSGADVDCEVATLLEVLASNTRDDQSINAGANALRVPKSDGT